MVSESMTSLSKQVASVPNKRKRADKIQKKTIKIKTEINTVSTSRNLPIYKHKNEILHSIQEHSATIVIGETGSGLEIIDTSTFVSAFFDFLLTIREIYSTSSISGR